MSPPGLAARVFVVLSLVAAHTPALFAQAGGPYELRRNTIDGGGGSAAGATYRAAMTIGQPDAGAVSS
jgi:hypothetical protein